MACSSDQKQMEFRQKSSMMWGFRKRSQSTWGEKSRGVASRSLSDQSPYAGELRHRRVANEVVLAAHEGEPGRRCAQGFFELGSPGLGGLTNDLPAASHEDVLGHGVICFHRYRCTIVTIRLRVASSLLIMSKRWVEPRGQK